MECWHHFDENFVPNDKYAGATATSSYGVDSNWYTDTEATNHVTSELEKLTIHDKYRGNDEIHTASGACMNISRIGHSVVKTPIHNLMWKNVLYTPKATKNLISVHKLAANNYAFLEYHPDFSVIKDRAMRKPLLRGRCHNSLYPLPVKSLKFAHGVFKPYLEIWHNRLGHPSIPIVERVISSFNLPCSSDQNKKEVCDACQKAKKPSTSLPKVR
jgi:hypothetical protein